MCELFMFPRCSSQRLRCSELTVTVSLEGVHHLNAPLQFKSLLFQVLPVELRQVLCNGHARMLCQAGGVPIRERTRVGSDAMVNHGSTDARIP